MRGPKPLDPEKQEQLEQRWKAQRRSLWNFVFAFLAVAALVVIIGIAQFRMQTERPVILTIYPDPQLSRDIPPNFEGIAKFSLPLDTDSVEGGIHYYEVRGGRLRGPFLLRERGVFEWSNNDKQVEFHLLPEYYPKVGDQFVIEASGMKGRNGQPLIPPSFRFKLRVVDKD
ncbi:MAG: hypothetical protein ACREJQ_03395, partial [bacterium]